MKRLLALLLCLALLLPVFSLAEDEEEDIDLFGEEDVDVDIDEDGNLKLADPENDASNYELSDEFMEQMADLFTADDSVDPDDLWINENLPDDEWINILLIGLDVKGTSKNKLLRDQDQYAKRADVQMILSINQIDGSIKLTSIARNTYVDIPDRTYDSSICNSWGHGIYKNGKYVGWENTPEMCLATVNKNFEMNIQYYVAINFYGVVSIIEDLGVADVELTKEEASYINSYLKKHKKAISSTYDDKKGDRKELDVVDGVQHLDGLQALMYARTRELDNDLGRTGRTRKLLNSILSPTIIRIKNRELDLENLILNEVPTYLKTNMNGQMIVRIIQIVLKSDLVKNLDAADMLIEEYRLPEDGAWGYGEDHYGNSVVRLSNKQEATEHLHEFIYGAYYPSDRY